MTPDHDAMTADRRSPVAADQLTQRQAKTRRVFFALWPTARTRLALVRSAKPAIRGCGGRPTPPGNLHMTIAFVGAVNAGQLERALSVPPIAVGPIDLVLDRLGYWARPRILWLGSTELPPALVELETRLWEGLAEVGFRRERRAFAPHVTLARAASAVDEAVEPVRWSARRLALVESVPAARGARYRPLRFWRLAG
jgi:RNA 2',3'-cyclic 3'-phosphodiesterase